jgi:uncharacterized protein (TIGR02145 family)
MYRFRMLPRTLIFFLLVFLVASACDDELDPLPETVLVEIQEKSLANTTVTLSATVPGRGLTGDWSFVSSNALTASFSSEKSPETVFTGDPFETYTVKWTITRYADSGPTETSKTITFRIADGYSVKELVDANISLIKIADSVLVGDIKAAGATDAQLRVAGVIGEVQDSEGNIYPWVKIKKHKWMTKNLRATKYSDGTPIEDVAPYNNDPSYTDTNGLLYDWHAARDHASREQTTGVQGVCPNGWHIPTYQEYLDLPSESVLLKTVGTLEDGNGAWRDPGDQSLEGNNNSGFSALPTGYGNYESDPDHPNRGLTYISFTEATGFWVSSYASASNTDNCGSFYLWFNQPQSLYVYSSGGNKLSVRCVQD